MSDTEDITCCNPLQLANHVSTRDLEHPRGRIVAKHPWLSVRHLVCLSCMDTLEQKYPKIQGDDSDDSEHYVMSVPSLPLDPQKKTIPYHKVVVPSTLRSVYWTHFGYPADEDGKIITKNRIVCLICNSVRAYIKSASNLHSHLQLYHPEELKDLENTPKPVNVGKKSHKKKLIVTPDRVVELSGELVVESTHIDTCDTSVENDNDKSSNGLIKIGKTRRKHLNIPQDSLKLITSELLPTSFIQSKGLVEFIEKINPGVKLPTSNQMNVCIPTKYEEIKLKIFNELCSVGEISLSVEEWQGINNNIFITISANYLKNNKFITKILKTFNINQINANSINDTFAEWGIEQEHIVAIVTATNQSSLLELLQQWGTVITCFQYTIGQSVAACFKLSEIDALISKCRRLISKHLNSNNLISNIQLDHPKNWTSTYEMLNELCNNKLEIILITSCDNIKLSDDDWNNLECIIEIFLPLKLTVQTLYEQSPGLSSVIKPLAYQLITNYLNVKPNETDFVYTLKILLNSTLVHSCNSNSNKLLLQTCAFIDPRFKQVSFLTDEENISVQTNIKKLLSHLDCIPNQPLTPSPAKKLCAMELLLGTSQQHKTAIPSSQVDVELSQLAMESDVSFDHNPLSWWRENELKYPTLVRLARTFMCVPACAIPASKLVGDRREYYERQRAKLGVDVVDKFLFLNENLV